MARLLPAVWLPIAACLALAACARDDGGPRAARPDVVILSIETLRADFVGAYGAPWGVTPRLDALAEESVVVSRAYAVAPWTRGNVGSLFTGVLPSRHGAVRNDARTGLAPALPTLAEAFSGAGYECVGVVTNSNLSERLGFARGFDEYVYVETRAAGPVNEIAMEAVRERLEPGLLDALFGRERAPLLLFVHYIEPHRAFFQSVFDPERGEGRAEFLAQLGPGERAAAIAGYLGLVRDVDAAVGALLDALLPRLRDPVVIVTADHGEEWFDHGSAFHGRTVHEEVIRVPLLIRVADRAPRVVQGPVRSIDLLPTLCELADVPCPDGLDGRSVVGALFGQGAFPEEVYAETEYEGPVREALLAGSLKLIRDAGSLSLYDLSSDPHETRDLHASHPDAPAMTRRLDAIRRELDRAAPARAPEPEPDAPGQDDLRRRLESLGYLAEPDDSQRSAPAEPWPRRALAYAQLDPATGAHVALGARIPPRAVSHLELAAPSRELHLVLARRRDSGPAHLRVEVDGEPWIEVPSAAFRRRRVALPLVLPPGAARVALTSPGGNVDLLAVLVPADPAAPPPSRLRGVAGALRLGDVVVTSADAQPLSLARLADGHHEIVVGSRPAELEVRVGDSYTLRTVEPIRDTRLELAPGRVTVEAVGASARPPASVSVESVGGGEPPQVVFGAPATASPSPRGERGRRPR